MTTEGRIVAPLTRLQVVRGTSGISELLSSDLFLSCRIRVSTAQAVLESEESIRNSVLSLARLRIAASMQGR